MRICAIAGCSNSGYTLEKWKGSDCEIHDVKYGNDGCDCKPPFVLYPFPTEKKNPDGTKEWIRIVNRKDPKTGKLWLPKYDDRICSDHFKNNEKSVNCPNPCINIGYKRDIVVRPAPKQRAMLEPKSKKRLIDCEPEVETIQDEPICHWDHDSYTYECDCSSDCSCSGCVVKEGRIKVLTQENANLKNAMEEGHMRKKQKTSNCEKFLKTDSKTKSYTGLPNRKAFNDLFKMLEPKAEKRKLDSKEELLMVLMKLRLGVNSVLLSDMFGVSIATISSIFNTWIKFLARELKPLIFWPDRDTVKTKMPTSLKHYKNLICTIDCTEVFITRPRDREIQALTWSDYKKHNTVKFLVGIAPNGTISYLSNAWGGRASDRTITIQDGFLDLVEPYDLILADRGFTIQSELLLKMATLEIPPASSGLEQMTSEKLKKTKKIANARIHVERAIGCIKWFAILQNTLPISLVPLIDDIIIVCAALCNLLPPLV